MTLTGCGTVFAHERSTSATVAAEAATATPSTTTTAAPVRTYVVARGDTLTVIAKRFGVDPEAIASANHLGSTDVLDVGQALRIPPAQPMALVVTPGEGPAGTAFELRLTGVRSSDTVTFSIAHPGHQPFTGPTHSPSSDGSVVATYETYPTDPAGQYVVLAHTSSGKGVFATFRVDASGPPAQGA